MKKIIPIMITISLVGFLIYAVTFQKKEIPVEKPGKVVATPSAPVLPDVPRHRGFR